MELVLPFDTDDPQFARGFEAGVLWGQLRDGAPVEVTLHVANIEMAIRMAETAGRCFVGRDLDEKWVSVIFS